MIPEFRGHGSGVLQTNEKTSYRWDCAKSFSPNAYICINFEMGQNQLNLQQNIQKPYFTKMTNQIHLINVNTQVFLKGGSK